MYSSRGSINDRNGEGSTTSGTPRPHLSQSLRICAVDRGIDVDVDRAHIGRQRARVVERPDHRPLDSADRDDHRILVPLFRLPVRQRQLRRDGVVMRSGDAEQHDLDRESGA